MTEEGDKRIEEVEKHILRKFDILEKLGKYVHESRSLKLEFRQGCLRNRVEGDFKTEPTSCSVEKVLRRLSERNGRPENVPGDNVFEGAARAREYSSTAEYL
jgi:hypothetical protein